MMITLPVTRSVPAKMEEDIKTQQHAQTIAHDYGICPVSPLKTERTLNPGTDINSLWLATGDGRNRCFVQYHSDDLPK